MISNEKNRVFQDHVKDVLAFISQSPLPVEIKERLLSQEATEFHQFLYLRLAFAFYRKYPGITSSQQTALSAATYLSATAVYAADHILDLQVTGPDIRPLYQLSHTCYLESQRYVAYLFPLDSPFWPAYYQRYQDHFAELEKSASHLPMHEADYRHLLSCKYALLHVVIDMLDHLTGCRHPGMSQQLHGLLEEFTFGYNLQNEVKGLQDDRKSGVANYAYWCLVRKCEREGIQLTDDPEYQHKLLFGSGLGHELLTLALASMEDVARKAEALDLPDFALIVRKQQEKTRTMLIALEAHLRELDSQPV